jgi:hypothetical protein
MCHSTCGGDPLDRHDRVGVSQVSALKAPILVLVDVGSVFGIETLLMKTVYLKYFAVSMPYISIMT